MTIHSLVLPLSYSDTLVIESLMKVDRQ
jgi:hypothetical protein